MTNLSPIAESIWDDKYRFKAADGKPIDRTIDDTWTRVAIGLAEAEDNSVRAHWAERFYDVLQNFEALPAGRIIAGTGTSRKVTLLNCYVQGNIEDSLAGIMSSLTNAAITMQAGAGIGMNFSTLRPKGSLIKSLGSGSSGPLSFMDQWDAMCRSIMSAGSRRGAMMGTMMCDHPDIGDFIEAKRDAKRFRMFNLSVLVTDAFMSAVKHDLIWELQFEGRAYRNVSARELWDKIMQATYDVADPGVLFIDRVNDQNPLRYAEKIVGFNPCGEQPLPEWGACCLGSVNLARLVEYPFTNRAGIRYPRLDEVVATMVRMLDNVLTISNYPLVQQQAEVNAKRRIGIGITGFADMLAMLGVKYSEGQELAGVITSRVAAVAHESSIELGKEKGSFPLFDASQYNCSHRRNSHLTSIAPTGTISLLAGNVSSGIEPMFDLEMERKILQPDNSWKKVKITDYAWGLYQQHTGGVEGDDFPLPLWETTAILKPIDHLNVLAACRPHVDSSVSKTINCPETISFEDFKSIYWDAYNMGCKSCTTYRPNAITGSILSSDTMKEQGAVKVEPKPVDNIVELTKPTKRPGKLDGATYKIKGPADEHAMYVTISNIEEHGRMRPFEIFVNTKNLEHAVWTMALTRMISAIFRKGGDLAFITEELCAVFDPRGGYMTPDGYVPSTVAAIGNTIRMHLESLEIAVPMKSGVSGVHCPKCQHGKLIMQEGCASCNECSYTRCG